MGASGYYISDRAVFYIAGALAVPAIVALFCIPAADIAPASDAARGEKAGACARSSPTCSYCCVSRGLVIFALCVMMFHLANAAMLPLAASLVTLRSDKLATHPRGRGDRRRRNSPSRCCRRSSARLADRWGRRPLLLFGFGALAIRGVLFALLADPRALVAIQLLDGVSAAALGVLVPLTIADLTRECGHFNLAQGAVGCAMGFGASLITTLSGYVSDHYGGAVAFDLLAAVAVAGLRAAGAGDAGNAASAIGRGNLSASDRR